MKEGSTAYARESAIGPSFNATRHYLFHGLKIVVSAPARALSESLHSRLSPFSSEEIETPDLTFRYSCVPESAELPFGKPSGPVRSIYDRWEGEVVYSDTEDRVYLDYRGRVRACCDPGRGSACISFFASEAHRLHLLTRPMFLLPFMELLKRRGRYSLHAAGLSVNGKGVLLAGASGAGKTTLALALLRAGFDFLGDDMVFLASSPEGPRVLAFPDEIDVTDETARRFPELQFLLDRAPAPGWPKRSFRAEDVYGISPVHECRPGILILPRIAHTERSELQRLDRREALHELAPNILRTESRSCQAHLRALTDLIGASECYRLDTGHDLDALPALLRGLVE